MLTQKEGAAFAVYLGGGWYLRFWNVDGSVPVGEGCSPVARPPEAGATVKADMYFDGADKAASLCRARAVSACHAARSMGASAWVVPHPACAA